MKETYEIVNSRLFSQELPMSGREELKRFGEKKGAGRLVIHREYKP
jgi:hypothetical protein